MKLKSHKTNKEVIICQNCATQTLAPKKGGEWYKLVYENDAYYWKNKTEDERIRLKSCCELPYFDELH